MADTPSPPRQEDSLPDYGFLADLDPALRQTLAKHGRFETLEPGAYVMKQGGDHHALSILIAGKLAVTCHAHGDLVELAELGPGHSVGEVGLLDPQKTSADVCVVDTPARLWTIEGEAFNELIESDQALGYAVMKVLAREMCRRLRQNSDHMLHQADELRTHFLDMD